MGGMDQRQKGTGGGILHHTSNWLSCKGSGTGGPDIHHTNNWIKFIQENWVLAEAHPSHHLQLYQNTALRRPCVVSVLTIPCSHNESSCSGVSGCAYFLHCPDSSGCKLFHSSVKHLSRLNEIQVFGIKNHQLRPFIIPTTS